jgi:hypothetical protein
MTGNRVDREERGLTGTENWVRQRIPELAENSTVIVSSLKYQSYLSFSLKENIFPIWKCSIEFYLTLNNVGSKITIELLLKSLQKVSLQQQQQQEMVTTNNISN